MTYDPLAFPEDAFIPEPDEETDPLQSPRDTLAWLLLHETLGGLGRRRVAGSRSFALVIQAPSEAYVAPLRDAASRLADFQLHCVRTGSDKVRDKPTYDNVAISEKLARGGRICGVSQDPSRYLPAALMAAADLRVTVGTPRTASSPRSSGRRPGAGRATCRPPWPPAPISIPCAPRSGPDRPRASASAEFRRSPRRPASTPPFPRPPCLEQL